MTDLGEKKKELNYGKNKNRPDFNSAALKNVRLVLSLCFPL